MAGLETGVPEDHSCDACSNGERNVPAIHSSAAARVTRPPRLRVRRESAEVSAGERCDTYVASASGCRTGFSHQLGQRGRLPGLGNRNLAVRPARVRRLDATLDQHQAAVVVLAAVPRPTAWHSASSREPRRAQGHAGPSRATTRPADPRAHAAGNAILRRWNPTSSACKPLPNPLPDALIPQDRDVAAMHLGANALGHDERADRIGSRAGADHPGGGCHRRVVVLVAQPLTTRSGRCCLRSAAFTPHVRPPSRGNRGGGNCTSHQPHHDTVVSQKRAGRETRYFAADRCGCRWSSSVSK